MLHKSTETVETKKDREQITLKAVVTTTDQGVFEAVISTESIDREKDIVSADAMVKALQKWPRPIPLAWEHRTNAEDIFGAIDPPSVKNVNGEVVAGGKVDLESPVGKEAWRSFKSRALGFSFGYLIITGTKRAGGGRHITELDVFEITATRAPMNNETRVLSTKTAVELQQANLEELQEVKAKLDTLEKAVENLTKKAEEADKEPETVRSVDPLRKRSEELALELVSDGMSLRKPPAQVKTATPDPIDTDELRRQSRDLMFEVLSYSTE